MAIDYSTDRGRVRLLLNDITEGSFVFTDDELDALLDLEGGSVKLAAAQAIDTNASNLVLASRVLRTQDLSTDGAKVADAMRAHADRLREQGESDDYHFEVIEPTVTRAELTEWPIY